MEAKLSGKFRVPAEMVVLSAAVCTKGGRTLFARQFVEMNRLRIEGLRCAAQANSISFSASPRRAL